MVLGKGERDVEGCEESVELGMGFGGGFGLDGWTVGPHAGLFDYGFCWGDAQVVGELVEDGVCAYPRFTISLVPCTTD